MYVCVASPDSVQMATRSRRNPHHKEDLLTASDTDEEKKPSEMTAEESDVLTWLQFGEKIIYKPKISNHYNNNTSYIHS